MWGETLEGLSNFQGFVVTQNISAAAADFRDLQQASERGKPILGVGEGARFLAEAGFVPGVENNRPAIALKSVEASEKQKHLKLFIDYQYNAFTHKLNPKQVYQNGLSENGERFIIPPGLLLEMRIQGLTVFLFSNEEDPGAESVAAVSNKAGNVMAMLCYPEFVETGDLILESMRDYIAAGHIYKVAPLYYYPRH